MVRVACYARVSTKDKNQDPESQFVAMRIHCKAKGYECGELDEFEDFESGKRQRTQNRPGLNTLREQIKQNRYDGVIITDLRRFSRSVSQGIALIEVLNDSNKWLETVQETKRYDNLDGSFEQLSSATLSFLMGQGDNIQHAKDVKRGIGKWEKEHPEKKWGSWEHSTHKGKVLPPIDMEKVIELSKTMSARAVGRQLGISKDRVLRIIRNQEKPDLAKSPELVEATEDGEASLNSQSVPASFSDGTQGA